MLLAGAVIILIDFLFFDGSPLLFLILIPCALVIFCLSLIIGHFLAHPLHLLARNITAFLDGQPFIAFTAKGQLYEADELEQNFHDLACKTQTQQNDLISRERRQSSFVSDVAHELRTPLTAIHGNAEMLLDPDLPANLHEKFCKIIIAESERLGRLSNDLLTLQRIEEGPQTENLQRINLNNLAQHVLEALTPMLRDRDAHTKIVGEAPDVLGNPDRLKQVISNLIENASRFISPHGHITIELFGLNNNSIIAVKDDGIGFGDIDPKLLFDRFYRTDASRSRGTGGAGLGLPIVKSIVEAHDGTIEAINLPDGGSCFIVAIPSIPAGS